MQFIVTMYGRTGSDGGDVLESFSFSACETEGGAQNYCDNINNVELKDDGRWVFAKIVGEHRKILPARRPVFGMEIFVRLDDRAIQKILREVDSPELSMALKTADREVQDKIFRNMSRRAAEFLREDMGMTDSSPIDIKAAQDRIIAIILHLSDTGEIVLPVNVFDESDKLVD